MVFPVCQIHGQNHSNIFLIRCFFQLNLVTFFFFFPQHLSNSNRTNAGVTSVPRKDKRPPELQIFSLVLMLTTPQEKMNKEKDGEMPITTAATDGGSSPSSS